MHQKTTGLFTRFTRNAIANAEQAGARQHAGAELDDAQQKLILAEETVENEKMLDADRYAQQALVLARLATARTESAKQRSIGRWSDALMPLSKK